MAAGEFDFGFAVEWMRKDLDDLPRRGRPARRPPPADGARRPVLQAGHRPRRAALGHELARAPAAATRSADARRYDTRAAAGGRRRGSSGGRASAARRRARSSREAADQACRSRPAPRAWPARRRGSSGCRPRRRGGGWRWGDRAAARAGRRTSAGRGWRRRARSARVSPGSATIGSPSAPTNVTAPSARARCAAPVRRSAAARRRRRRRATDRRATARSWSGLRSSASVPLPIRLTVVSWPATYSSTTNAISSAGLSVSPSSSTDEQRRQQVVAGCARRSSMIVDEVRDQLHRSPPRRRRGRPSWRPARAPSVSAWHHVAQLVGAVGRHVEQVARSPGTAPGRRARRRARSRRARRRGRARRRPSSRSAAAGARSAIGVNALRHQPAQPGVVGRVEVEDRLGAPPRRSRRRTAIGSVASMRGVGLDVAAEVVAAQDVRDVVVAADARAVRPGVWYTGRLGAQAVVERVRVRRGTPGRTG